MNDVKKIRIFIKKVIIFNFFVGCFCILIGMGYLYIIIRSFFSTFYTPSLYEIFITFALYIIAIFNIRAGYLLYFKSDYYGIKIIHILYPIQFGFFMFLFIFYFPYFSWVVILEVFSFIVVILTLIMIFSLKIKKEEIKECFDIFEKSKIIEEV